MASSEISIKDGVMEWKVDGVDAPVNTWYRVYGDLGSKQRPLFALHGGPGIGHNYLLSLADLATKHGIPLIIYDQLGCGNSTHLREKNGDNAFWKVDLFTTELSKLVKHLGLKSYDVFGNSWGGMLAAEYATLQPEGLHSIIVADSPADMVDWVKAANKLRAKLPKDVQETLTRCEREGKTETEEYEKAVQVFYRRHVCRLDPWPKDVDDTFANIKDDSTVYMTMNGPSEFYVIGGLKSWSIKGRLSKIQVPTMLLNGRHDEAMDEVVQPYFEKIKQVRWFTFADSAHMPHWEERDLFMERVAAFVKG